MTQVLMHMSQRVLQRVTNHAPQAFLRLHGYVYTLPTYPPMCLSKLTQAQLPQVASQYPVVVVVCVSGAWPRISASISTT